MAAPDATPVVPRRRRGWFRRHWWWLVPVFLLVPVLAAGGYVFAVVAQKKSSEPYRMALEQVRKDPQVIQRLGEPIKDVTWIPTGFVNAQGQRGEATLGFNVAGPKGQTHVSTQARKIAGQWGLNKLEVTLDGKRVPLDTSPGGDEAPKFNEAPKFSAGAPASDSSADASKQPPATPAGGPVPDLPKPDSPGTPSINIEIPGGAKTPEK